MKNNAKETRQIIFDVFDSLKIPCGECLFYDGSGLSRRNKITAEALIRILEITSHSNFSSDLDSCLAIAGVDGTVKSRMSGTLAENNLLAKTGTHGNVSALTGYVRTLDGERLSYAFMFNGSAVNHFKQTENELGKLLAQFFYFNMER
jgi:D-alanyl-D-alanine carboxypeptidase